MIEAKTKDIEAKTKEIEAKCLSEAEIKVLITDDCSKNSCQNAKPPSRPSPNGRPRQNRDSDEVVNYPDSYEVPRQNRDSDEVINELKNIFLSRF